MGIPQEGVSRQLTLGQRESVPCQGVQVPSFRTLQGPPLPTLSIQKVLEYLISLASPDLGVPVSAVGLLVPSMLGERGPCAEAGGSECGKAHGPHLPFSPFLRVS